MKNLLFRYWLPLSLFLVCLIAYWMTMARYVMNTDNGELSAVAFFWGTAHPTGYPLFTILGYLASHFPFPVRPLLKLNFLSAFFCASAIPFLFLALRNFLMQSGFEERVAKYSSILGSLSVAFSITFWSQSTSFEVYSLHCLLLAIGFWAISRILNDDLDPKYWFVLAIIIGLSFTNHMSTIVLAPGIALLFFGTWKLNKSGLANLLKFAALGLIPILFFYGVLWFRASQDPLFNWGDPSSSMNFWRHVSGAQYQVWMFESSDISTKNLKAFFSGWPGEFGYLAWIISLFGIWQCWKKQHRIFWVSVLFFFGNVLYVINYSIHDLEPYFLLAYLTTGLWIAFGAAPIIQDLDIKKLIVPALLSLPLAVGISNAYQKVDKSSYDLIENYSRRALISLPENSILISRQWDIFNSPCYYLQFVEGVRPDVEIIGKELLRRSWYYSQLSQMYPETMEKIQTEVAPFLVQLEPFEKGEEFNSQKLSQYFQGIFASLITTNIESRPVLIGAEIFSNDIKSSGEFSIPRGVFMFPEDYFIRLTITNQGKSNFVEDYGYAYTKNEDVYSEMIKQGVSQMRTFQALYLLSIGQRQKAKSIALDIRRKHRSYFLPQSLMALL